MSHTSMNIHTFYRGESVSEGHDRPPEDFSVFDALRDTIYSEVATLIANNENRPHFLVSVVCVCVCVCVCVLHTYMCMCICALITNSVSLFTYVKYVHVRACNASFLHLLVYYVTVHLWCRWSCFESCRCCPLTT